MKNFQSTLLNKFPNITYCFTQRQNGNLAFHVGDDADNVIKNHDALAEELNYDKKTLVHMKQIHSDIVHIVKDEDDFYNPPTCDALITNKIDTPLMVMVADCTPILFYDQKKEVIAVAHAGRQGAFKNIVNNVIYSFKKDFGSDTKDIFVSIGANICKECYEVGEEIFDEAKKLNLHYAIDDKNHKFYLDIKSILLKQLLESEIDEKNIELSNECSCCSYEKYFSYRTDNKTGRFAGVIKLKE